MSGGHDTTDADSDAGGPTIKVVGSNVLWWVGLALLAIIWIAGMKGCAHKHTLEAEHRAVIASQTPAPQAAAAQQPAQAAEASQPGNILFKIGKEIQGSLTKGGQAGGANAWAGVPVPTFEAPPKGIQTITSPSETNHADLDAQANYSAVIPGRVYYDFYPRLGLRDSTHKLQCYEKPAQAWLTVSPGSTCSDAAGYRVQCTNGSGSSCPFEYYWSPAAKQ